MSDDPIRDRLIAAATEVFAERGYDGAGVAEIARRAGLTTGAIYSRYRGKADLLVDALDETLAHQLEVVLADRAAARANDALALLGAQLLADEKQYASVLLMEAVVAGRRDPELHATLGRRLEDERARVAKLIEEGKAEGLFDPGLETEAVVTFCQSIGLGFVLMRTMGMTMPEAPAWQTVIDRVVTAAAPQQEMQ
jgi:TetR/AcrR family transcriptional regulator, repressor for uid operon